MEVEGSKLTEGQISVHWLSNDDVLQNHLESLLKHRYRYILNGA